MSALLIFFLALALCAIPCGGVRVRAESSVSNRLVRTVSLNPNSLSATNLVSDSPKPAASIAATPGSTTSSIPSSTAQSTAAQNSSGLSSDGSLPNSADPSPGVDGDASNTTATNNTSPNSAASNTAPGASASGAAASSAANFPTKTIAPPTSKPTAEAVPQLAIVVDDFTTRKESLWQFPSSSVYKSTVSGDALVSTGDPVGSIPMRLNSALTGDSTLELSFAASPGGCGSHFLMLSTEKQQPFAGFKKSAKTVVLGWTCRGKALLSPLEEQTAPCSRQNEAFSMKLRVSMSAGGEVSFVDQKCAALKVATPFTPQDKVAVYVGGAPSTGGASLTLKSFRAQSIFSPLAEAGPAAALFSDALTAFNASLWEAGGAREAGPFSLRMGNKGAVFGGDPTKLVPLRLKRSLLSRGLRLELSVTKNAACGNPFVVLSTAPDWRWNGFAKSDDALVMGFDCGNKVLLSKAEKAEGACAATGTLAVSVDTAGKVRFSDIKCGTLEVNNPFREEDTLYLYLGAAPGNSSAPLSAATMPTLSKLAVYGEASTVTPPPLAAEEPAKPVFTDALAAANSSKFNYGDASSGAAGKYSYDFSRGGLAFLGDPTGRVTARVGTPLQLTPGLKVTVEAVKGSKCANLFLALSTDHQMKWKGLAPTEGAVTLGWNCGSKQLHSGGSAESQSQPCQADGEYSLTLALVDGKFVFSDSKNCATLSVGSPFGDGDSLFLFLGAQPEPRQNRERSRWANLKVYGALSNATVAVEEPEAPVFDQPLTPATADGFMSWGQAELDGPYKRQLSPEGVSFSGIARGRTASRLSAGYMNGLRAAVVLSKSGPCANQFLALSTDYAFAFGGLRPTPDAVVLGWDCDSRQLHTPKVSRVQAGGGCGGDGNYTVSVDTFGSSIVLSDAAGRCAKQSVPNPFDAGDTLYLFLGASPRPALPPTPSPFAHVTIFGTPSNVTAPADPEPTPVLTASLAAKNDSAVAYVGCDGVDATAASAKLGCSHVSGGLGFTGNPVGSLLPRMSQAFLNGMRLKIKAFRESRCANLMLLLSTSHNLSWAGTEEAGEHTVLFTWGCHNKQLRAPKATKEAPCAPSGEFDVEVSTAKGKLSFADSRCPALSVRNPFDIDDTLYLYLAAAPQPAHLRSASRFAALYVYGTLSTVEIPEEPVAPPPPPPPPQPKVVKPKPSPPPPPPPPPPPDEVPAAKPVLQSVCSSNVDCRSCTAQKQCGWVENLQKCLLGDVAGPTPRYDGPVRNLTRPVHAFMFAIKATSWDFLFCKAGRCADYPSCARCLGDSVCGWCGSSSTCTEGDKAGATSGYCVSDWVHSPVGASLDRVRAASPQLQLLKVASRRHLLRDFCVAGKAGNIAARNEIQQQLESDAARDARLKRQRESCGVCTGIWPHCDCGGNVTSSRPMPLDLHISAPAQPTFPGMEAPEEVSEEKEEEEAAAKQEAEDEASYEHAKKEAEEQGIEPPPPPPPAPKRPFTPKPPKPLVKRPSKAKAPPQSQPQPEAAAPAPAVAGNLSNPEKCGEGTVYDPSVKKCVSIAVASVPTNVETVNGTLRATSGSLPSDPIDAAAQSHIKALLVQGLNTGDTGKIKELLSKVSTVAQKADAEKSEEQGRAMAERSSKLEAQAKAQQELTRRLEQETASAKASVAQQKQTSSSAAEKEAAVGREAALQGKQKKQDLVTAADAAVALDKQEIARDSATVTKSTADAAQATQEAEDARDAARRYEEAGNSLASKQSLAQAEVLTRRAALLTESVKAAQERVKLKEAKLAASKQAQEKAYKEAAAASAAVLHQEQASLDLAAKNSKAAKDSEQSVLSGAAN